MNIYKQYIQLGIDNGYKLNGYEFKSCDVKMGVITFTDKFGNMTESNFYDVISSKEFINVISKLLWNNSRTLKRKQDYKDVYTPYKKIYNKQFKDIKGLEDYVTYLQALAKRDGGLEDRISIFMEVCNQEVEKEIKT